MGKVLLAVAVAIASFIVGKIHFTFISTPYGLDRIKTSFWCINTTFSLLVETQWQTLKEQFPKVFYSEIKNTFYER